MRRLLLLAAIFAAVALIAAACGGDNGDGAGGEHETPGASGDTVEWPRAQEPVEGDITPLVLNSQTIVGDRRFVVALQDQEQQLVLNADVTLRFYTIADEQGTLVDEVPATFVSMTENFVHEHADGEQHTHTGQELGAYVANTTFDRPGEWGVEIAGTHEGESFGPIRTRFNVLEEGTVPAIGDPAPATEQPTIDDVDDISQIDSSNPPHPEMHDMTVAEALEAGRPFVVAFVTPAFCTSRLCGPVMDEVIVPLWERYGEQVEFIHIEPYDLDTARNEGQLVPVPALEEWGLQTEPYVIVVDSDGLVTAKFEGMMGLEEVETAVQDVAG